MCACAFVCLHVCMRVRAYVCACVCAEDLVLISWTGSDLPQPVVLFCAFVCLIVCAFACVCACVCICACVRAYTCLCGQPRFGFLDRKFPALPCGTHPLNRSAPAGCASYTAHPCPPGRPPASRRSPVNTAHALTKWPHHFHRH